MEKSNPLPPSVKYCIGREPPTSLYPQHENYRKFHLKKYITFFQQCSTDRPYQL